MTKSQQRRERGGLHDQSRCVLGSLVCLWAAWLPEAQLQAASAPNQPTFYSWPSPARLYPYSFADVVNGPYTVVVDYTDPDGASDVLNSYLQIKGDGAAQTILYANMTTAAQWAGEGDHLYNITASKTSIAKGYRVTYGFQIKGDWTPSIIVSFEAWSLDKESLQSTHCTYAWNGIYDNNLHIAGAQRSSWVDNDGDGYASSVTLGVNVDTSVSSRTVDVLLYRRDSGTGANEVMVWESSAYTVTGSTVDWKSTTVTVPSKGTYDFRWDVYDPGAAGWEVTSTGYGTYPALTGVKMEPAPQDNAPAQPTFNSVPTPARLYPYSYPDVVNGPYTVVVDYTDLNGAADLQHVYLRLNGGGASQTIMYYNLSTIQTWEGASSQLYNLTASKAAIANGYRVTYSFQMKATWTPTVNVDFEAFSLNISNVESGHRTYDWNGIYDNNLHIAGAQKSSWVDNDGDGYASSVTLGVNVETSVSSRTVDVLLYRRDSGTGANETLVWESDAYTITGSTVDWKSTTVTVPSKGTYDFRWDVYDPGAAGWGVTSTGYDTYPDLTGVKMEPASEDIAQVKLPPGNGMWLRTDPYFAPIVGNEAAIISKLVQGAIRHVFVHLPATATAAQYADYAQYAPFVQQAHAQSLTVHANCCNANNAAALVQSVNDLVAYNNSYPAAMFDGVYIDVEGVSGPDLVSLVSQVQVPPTLVFSAAVQINEATSDIESSCGALVNAGVDLLVPMVYITDFVSYSGSNPSRPLDIAAISSRTTGTLQKLPAKGQLMTGLASYDLERAVSKSTGAEDPSFLSTHFPGEDPSEFPFDPDPRRHMTVTNMAGAGTPLTSVFWNNNDGISIYRFDLGSDYLDIQELPPSTLRRSITAALQGASGDSRYVGSCVWSYPSTFDPYSLRNEGLGPDDGAYPIPNANVQVLGFQDGVATLRVTLSNANPAERVLGAHAGAGVHLRLEGATFSSAGKGTFHAAEAFDTSGNLLGSINGAQIVELRRCFFENSASQQAQSGDILVNAISSFTVRYRSWMMDKDSMCSDGGSPEPYIARTPDDIHYNSPARFLLYATVSSVIVPTPAAPTAAPATGVSASGFTANWSGSSGATGYRLDVSTSTAFTSYMGIYRNLDVGNVMNTNVAGLSANTPYYYRVRAYNAGGTSGNSGTVSLTTGDNPPSQPSNVSPSDGATNQTLTLTLQASAFSDPDLGDTHAASQWVVQRVSDSALMFDSGEDTVNKTSISIPAGSLNYATAYSWQVRYKDSHGMWSGYSDLTQFSTQQTSPPVLSFRPPNRLESGAIELFLECRAGWTYWIQASTNLADWRAICSITPSSNEVAVIDTNATSLATCYYRAIGFSATNATPHPADLNADFQITGSEITAYTLSYHLAFTWPVPPYPIPDSYFNAAIYLLKHGGGYYHCDPTLSPPDCWVSGK